jgi:hypothetical protein
LYTDECRWLVGVGGGSRERDREREKRECVGGKRFKSKKIIKKKLHQKRESDRQTCDDDEMEQVCACEI